jgi:hypothetical protein
MWIETPTIPAPPPAPGTRPWEIPQDIDCPCPPTDVQIFENASLEEGPPSLGTPYCNPCFAVRSVNGNTPLRLATRDLASFFIGALDEVAIYPRVLTSDEILENYQLAIA